MAVRRKTTNRWTLFRTCAVCGKEIVTTADTPFVRGVVTDGKQKTEYYCSESCKNASYRHKFDGKADERKKERERNRDRSGQWTRYYAAHGEEVRARRKRNWYAMSEQERYEENKYYRHKRKLLAKESA